MQGKRTRCQNPVCRAVFEVQEANGEGESNGGTDGRNPPASSVTRQVGNVSDLIPFLEAEATGDQPPLDEPKVSDSWENAPPVRKAPSAQKSSWSDAPPPVRRTDRPTDATPDTAKSGELGPATPEEKTLPVEIPAGEWEAPPIRKKNGVVEVAQAFAPAPPSAPVPATRRRAPLMITVVVLLVAGGAVGIVYWVYDALAQSEDGRYKTALQQFNDKQYTRAENSFAALSSEFPDSERRAEYQFRHALSQSLRPAFELGKDPFEAMKALEQFIQDKSDDSRLRENAKPIREGFDQITKNLASEARQALTAPVDIPRARQKLQHAKKSAKLVGRFGNGADSAIGAELTEIALAIDKTERRQTALTSLKPLAATAEGIRQAERIIAQNDLQTDAEATAILNELRDTFRGQVSYVAAPPVVDPLPGEAVDPELIVVTAETVAPTGDRPADGVFFALARGVLYALAQKDGRFLWATRLGVDTPFLPITVPANETLPEVALVWSSTNSALVARDIVTGRKRWQVGFEAQCVAPPLLADRRLYVPTVDGKVHEIEADSGRRLGWFAVGLPLRVCGVHEEGTDHLYFAADSQCVFVLDTKEKTCVRVIQTGHPSGSLRGPPILLRPDRTDPVTRDGMHSGYIILCQAQGLDSMRLRATPIASKNSASAPISEVTVRGWSWFEPFFDGEKIVMVTDLGTLGVFGINQRGNQDSPIFGMLPQNPTLRPLGQENPVRSQLVFARDREFWVLIDGQLHQLELVIERDKGLRLDEVWKHGTRLGSPLHAAQVDGSGEQVFVVTQSVDGDACLATAIHMGSNKIVWQRRLGVAWKHEPISLNGRILALDQAAALYEFDPNEATGEEEGRRTLGKLLAAPPEARGRDSFLIESPDGKAAYVIAANDDGTSLEVARHESGKNPNIQTVKLRSPLSGTPALGHDWLLLPLADGSLLRHSLDGKPARSGTWRTGRGERNPPGQVLYLGSGEYITSDGRRNLTRWRWNVNEESPKEEARTELTEPVVGTLALLPPGLPGGERYIAVADTAGVVRILQGSDLRTVRMWNLKGQVTAGPYVNLNHLACVVDQKRLAWIEPEQEGFWEFVTEGNGIVGRPQIVGDAILVADRVGTLVALEPTSGKPKGQAQTPTSAAVPAATPVEFGSGKALVPMTDGTVTIVENR